jgi:ubiquinone/menaquinone biosynthesis C-methylase UbiE
MAHTDEHDQQILEQFTKQAVPFAARHRADDELMKLLLDCSGVSATDHVLDIACGPGIVSCAFAARAEKVTGIDFVPAMLEQASLLQKKKQLSNCVWRQGEATRLPFADGTFDCVVTRFSFHHYLEPAAAFREMTRVCKPGGTVLVVDVAPRLEAREAYDAMEKLRDPSHSRALTEEEFENLGNTAGVRLLRKDRYNLEAHLEGLLQDSFPPPGNADRVRRLVEGDLRAEKPLGIDAFSRNDVIYFFFPVLILAWKKD